jgi:hypothetical protein
MAFTPVSLPTTGTNPKAGEINNWNTEINRALGEVADRANHTGTQSGATLTDGTVATAKLADGAATTAKLADGAATTAKIADGAATTAKLADAAVTEPKLAANAVSNGKLAEVGTATYKGRRSGGTGAVEDMTRANVKSDLGVTNLEAKTIAALSTVAGTGTAYTAASDRQMAAGMRFTWTPHLTNTGNATITITNPDTTVTSASGLRTTQGVALTAGELRAGTAYDCLYNGGTTVVLGLRRGTVAESTFARRAASTEAAAYYDSLVFAIHQGSDEDAINIVDATPYWFDAISVNRPVRVSGTTAAWANAQYLPIGARSQLIDVASGAEIKVWCGPAAGAVWRSSAGVLAQRHITLAASGVYRIYRTAQDAYVVETVVGTAPAAVVHTVPVHDRTFVWAGQSIGDRLKNAGLYGFQKTLPGTYFVDASEGSSSVADGVTTSGKTWWDTATTAPETLATALMTAVDAAIALGQPAPCGIAFAIGQTELFALGGTLTSAKAYEARAELVAWIRAQVGNAFLPIVWVPVGIRDGIAGGTDAQYSEMRYIDLVFAGNDPDIYSGLSIYDLSQKYGDVHLDYAGMDVAAYRIGQMLDNILNTAGHDEGPQVVSIEELSGGLQYKIGISQGDFAINRPPVDVQGFGIYPAGETPLTGTMAQIATNGFAWTYDEPTLTHFLTITLETAVPGGTVVYPVGRGGAASGVSDMRSRRFVWQVAATGDTDSDAAAKLQNFLPLVPFVGKAGTPPAIPAPLWP